MPDVQCTRCGSSAEGLDSAPLPGEVGENVRRCTCRACWDEWLKAQVMVINENKLSPANPEHYRTLIDEMSTFLSLERE